MNFARHGTEEHSLKINRHRRFYETNRKHSSNFRKHVEIKNKLRLERLAQLLAFHPHDKSKLKITLPLFVDSHFKVSGFATQILNKTSRVFVLLLRINSH